MFTQWLHLNQYTQIPQKAKDDEMVEEQGEPVVTSHVRYKRFLSFLCLIALSVVIGVAGFTVGVETARRQHDRPAFSNTINQGLYLNRTASNMWVTSRSAYRLVSKDLPL